MSVTRRKMWASVYIARGTSARPAYGSPAWCTLADDDPDKIAACVVAAECWASQGDTLEEDLRREVEQLRIGHKRREDEEYQAAWVAHRERWPALSREPLIERRRRQLAATGPRPSDHPGGPGKPWTGGDAS